MKKIVLACGSGIATSTMVAAKVKDLLDAHGYAGQYRIVQCAVAEAAVQSADADLLIATTMKPGGVACPFISGIPYLTGMGKDQVDAQVLEFMEQ